MSKFLFALVWLILPLLAGCDTDSLRPTTAPSETFDTAVSPPTMQTLPVAATTSHGGQTIQFQSVDTQYRGTTRILPDKTVVHQGDPDE